MRNDIGVSGPNISGRARSGQRSKLWLDPGSPCKQRRHRVGEHDLWSSSTRTIGRDSRFQLFFRRRSDCSAHRVRNPARLQLNDRIVRSNLFVQSDKSQTPEVPDGR